MKKFLGLLFLFYMCFCCGKFGYYIKNCLINGDKNFEFGFRIKKSIGIFRSFMMEVKDFNMKGVMFINIGKYVILIIDVEVYVIGKKEKFFFLLEELFFFLEEDDFILDELLCFICKDIMIDVVVIFCCGNSYCDECIRIVFLELDEYICLMCY